MGGSLFTLQAYLDDFEKFCSKLGGATAEVMGDLLAFEVRLVHTCNAMQLQCLIAAPCSKSGAAPCSECRAAAIEAAHSFQCSMPLSVCLRLAARRNGGLEGGGGVLGDGKASPLAPSLCVARF